MEEDVILMHKITVYVLDSCEIRKLILQEMHNVPYDGHQGYQMTLVAVRK